MPVPIGWVYSPIFSLASSTIACTSTGELTVNVFRLQLEGNMPPSQYAFRLLCRVCSGLPLRGVDTVRDRHVDVYFFVGGSGSSVKLAGLMHGRLTHLSVSRKDIMMDWSLLQKGSKYPLLRNELIYGDRVYVSFSITSCFARDCNIGIFGGWLCQVYYFAMVSDPHHCLRDTCHSSG